MDKFTQKVMDFFERSKDEALINYNKDNEIYKSLKKTNTLNSIQLEKAITNLDQKNIEIIHNYNESVYKLDDMEKDMLYLQGYKDCVKLLKLIELL